MQQRGFGRVVVVVVVVVVVLVVIDEEEDFSVLSHRYNAHSDDRDRIRTDLQFWSDDNNDANSLGTLSQPYLVYN